MAPRQPRTLPLPRPVCPPACRPERHDGAPRRRRRAGPDARDGTAPGTNRYSVRRRWGCLGRRGKGGFSPAMGPRKDRRLTRTADDRDYRRGVGRRSSPRRSKDPSDQGRFRCRDSPTSYLTGSRLPVYEPQGRGAGSDRHTGPRPLGHTQTKGWGLCPRPVTSTCTGPSFTPDNNNTTSNSTKKRRRGGVSDTGHSHVGRNNPRLSTGTPTPRKDPSRAPTRSQGETCPDAG